MQSRQANRSQNANNSEEGLVRFLRAGDCAAAEKLIYDHIANMGHASSVKPMMKNALRACSRSGQSGVAGWLVEKLIGLGFPPDELIFNLLLAAFAKSGDIKGAAAWWPYMLSVGAVPNTISYNTMIHACAQANDSRQAVHWMNKLLASDVHPCKISFATIISAFAKRGHWQEAELWFYKMEELNLLPDTCIFNNIISACAKAGKFLRAEHWLSRMESCMLYPDQRTYNTVINLCAKTGDLAKATSLYTKMQRAGKDPDVFTFGPLLYACVMVADLEAAEGFMYEMESRGIKPNLVCYNTTIHCCAVCGDAERAMSWYQRLRDRGFQGRKITFSYLLSACVMAGRKDLAEKTLHHMTLNGCPPDWRDFANVDEIVDGQATCRSSSLIHGNVTEFQTSNTTISEYGIVSDSFNEGCHHDATSPPREIVHVSGEALSLSQQGVPLAHDNVFNDEGIDEQTIHYADLTWLQESSMSKQTPVANKGHTLANPQRLGFHEHTSHERDSLTTSSTCVNPIWPSERGELAIESRHGPDPSEIGNVPLAWLDHGM